MLLDLRSKYLQALESMKSIIVGAVTAEHFVQILNEYLAATEKVLQNDHIADQTLAQSQLVEFLEAFKEHPFSKHGHTLEKFLSDDQKKERDEGVQKILNITNVLQKTIDEGIKNGKIAS